MHGYSVLQELQVEAVSRVPRGRWQFRAGGLKVMTIMHVHVAHRSDKLQNSSLLGGFGADAASDIGVFVNLGPLQRRGLIPRWILPQHDAYCAGILELDRIGKFMIRGFFVN
jgi:hypothetical protein